MQDHEGNTTTHHYDAVGNRTGISHANGIQTGYVYDELNRLTSLVHKDSSNTTLKRFDYTLLANGKRAKIEQANGRTTDYSYDSVGNRTYETVNGVSTQYTLDANDRLVQTGGTSYTHDAQGNTLTETLSYRTPNEVMRDVLSGALTS